MAHLLRKKPYVLAIAILLALVVFIEVFYLTTQYKAQTLKDETLNLTCGSAKQYDEQVQCWINGIKKIIQGYGVQVAFDTISNNFLNEPSFRNSCNQILHEIGHWTYHHVMENNTEFVMPPKINLCASGFDRGFVEELAATTGDFSKGKEFCSNPQLASESTEATARCFHAIGHGALSFYGPDMAGEEQKLIEGALEVCTRFSSTSAELDYCTGGVFSEVVLAYQTNKYGLLLNREDPFAHCQKQADRFKYSCYYSVKPLLLWLSEGDFRKAASLVENIVEDEYAIAAIDSLTTSVTIRNIANNVSIANYVKDISICRTLQQRLRAPCVAGLAIELLTHSGHSDALEFCRLPILEKQELDACFKRIAPNLAEWIPKDEIQHVCASLEEQYKQFCRY